MQATGDNGATESGASVQRGSVRTVTECGRCHSEVEYVDGFEAGEVALRWSSIAIATGHEPSRLIALCPACTRTFRLFMLRAATGVDVEATWQRIVSGAV